MTAGQGSTRPPLAVLGRLRLTDVTGHGFRVGDTTPLEIEVESERSVLGRSDEADIVVVDPSESVSRLHALIELDSGGWWIYDWSSYGTRLEAVDKDGTLVRAKLARGTGERLTDGMRISLADTTVLAVALVRPPLTGNRTHKPAGARVSTAPPLLDDDMRAIARALCAPYRRLPPRHAASTVEEVAEIVAWSESTVRNRLRELAAKPAIRAQMDRGDDEELDRHELAAALVRLYPNLAERPREPK